jgi:hypothetical protein
VKTFAAASLLTLLVTAAASGAAPAPAAAPAASGPAPNWYNVEVIVFRLTDPDAGSQETWPADPGVPDWNGATPLSPPDSVGTAVPYQLLSPVAEQLGDAWNRLKHSKNYEPLLHVTWTQPALDRATAPAVRLGVPPLPVPAAATAPMPQPVAAPAIGVDTNTATSPQPTLAYGDAKLSTTGPYLHFDLDLVLEGPLARNAAPASASINTAVLAPPGSTAVAPVPTFQLYRLRHDMRVNGGKLAYFDNPLFGAIVLVTPVRRQ